MFKKKEFRWKYKK